MRFAFAFALTFVFGACRHDGSAIGAGSLVIETSLSAMPSNVGSYRLTLTQLSGNNACGSAVTTVSTCKTASGTFTVGNLCSGTWQVDASTTAAFTSTDCTGAPLNAISSGTPSPVTINYAGTGSLVLHFQGASTLIADNTFTTGAPAAPLVQSVSFKAQRTFHPDVASCATAVTTIGATCVAATAGVDLAAATLSSSACSGQWILCAQAFTSVGCTGSVVEQGISSVQSVGFGATAPLASTTSVLGPNCPF